MSAEKEYQELLLANVTDEAPADAMAEVITDQYEKMILAVLILARKVDPTREFLAIVDNRDMSDSSTGEAFNVQLALKITPIQGAPEGEAKH